MYQAIFFMTNGSIVTRVFNSYPTDSMIETSGLNWDDISSYEVQY